MEDRDKMALRQLLQYHGAPAVLNALADVANATSVELRERRDSEHTAAGRRVCRKLAAAWEAIAKLLHRCAQIAREKL